MHNSTKGAVRTVLDLVSLFFGLLTPFAVLFSSVPSSPLATEGSLKEVINAVLPQYWSFFVFDPKIEQTRLYRLLPEENKLERINLSYSSKSSFSGLSRNIRATNIAFESLQKQIPDSAYATIKDFALITSLTDTLSTVHVRNSTRVGCLKGFYVIVKSLPKSWEQRGAEDEAELKIAKIYVHGNDQ